MAGNRGGRWRAGRWWLWIERWWLWIERWWLWIPALIYGRRHRRRAGWRWLWIGAGVAATSSVAAVVGIWHLPGRMYPGTSDGVIQARAALQGGLLTAAAALAAVAGGLIALDETRRANANTHVRELYVEAAKLLNDPDNLGVRLAGIYALERITADSPADQRTVVEVLSAFVRERSTDPALRPTADTPARRAPDIHAAVQVLGRLPSRADVPRMDLTGAWLVGADLTGAQLRGANLAGAQLSMANLTDAQLSGTHLAGAQLSGANLTRAWLGGANLTDAQLSGTHLAGAQLSGANLTRAWLSMANLAGAQLGGANLTRAWLFGAYLAGAWLHGANLTDAGGLIQAQVDDGVLGDRYTRLPVGLVWPEFWGDDPGAS